MNLLSERLDELEDALAAAGGRSALPPLGGLRRGVALERAATAGSAGLAAPVTE